MLHVFEFDEGKQEGEVYLRTLKKGYLKVGARETFDLQSSTNEIEPEELIFKMKYQR